MPKVRIVDTDKTAIAQLSPLANVIYMPGPVISAELGGIEPKLFTSVAQLNDYNINKSNNNSDLHYKSSSLSYKLMYRLLEYGLYVLYEGVKETIEGVCPQINWVRLEDRSQYNIRYLTMGGYSVVQANDTTFGSMSTCVAKRGDCVALLDHPSEFDTFYTYPLIESEPADWESAWTQKYKGEVYAYTLIASEPANWESAWDSNYKGKVYTFSEGVYTVVNDNSAPTFVENTFYTRPVVDDDNAPTFAVNTFCIRKEVTDLVDKIRFYFTQYGSTDDSYVAAFTPSIITTDSLFKKSATAYYNIPASFGYLFAYAKAIRNNPEWYAIAGAFRGTISELSDVEFHFSNEEVERLQGRAATGEVDLDAEGDNVGRAINTISFVRPYGYVVWGNRTFRVNTKAEGTIATSFLNVRCLVNIIKKKMYDAARLYTFEPNNEILWASFKSQIVPTLEQMMSGNGIEAYRFTRLATDKKARLKAKLTIVPIEAVEDFDLEIELANSLSVTE